MTPAPTIQPPPHRRFWILRFCIAALGLLLASFLLLQPVTRPPSPDMVWLTPKEREQLIRPKPLTRFKWQLISLAPPQVWRYYRSKQPAVGIASHLLTLPPNAVELAALPTAVSTNQDGARAWILSPSDFKTFWQRIGLIPGATIAGSPSVQTSGDSQAQVSMINNISIAGKLVPVGLTVDLAPKIVGDSVRLVVAATSTSPFDSAENNTPTAIRTNLSLVCQAWLTNKSGLIMDGGSARDAKGNSYWFILSPTIIDANGNPRK